MVARTRAWFGDPLTAAQRRRLVAIPDDLTALRSGPVRRTRSFARSRHGHAAVAIPNLRGRALDVGQAATLSQRGLFAFDSARLTTRGRAEVRQLVASLRHGRAVRCEGYADYGGEAGHELTLSRRRARAVCSALVRYGAEVAIASVGYGGARPAVVGGTTAERKPNRRVVVVVTR